MDWTIKMEIIIIYDGTCYYLEHNPPCTDTFDAVGLPYKSCIDVTEVRDRSNLNRSYIYIYILVY